MSKQENLQKEFDENLKALRAEGLVDSKATIDVQNSSLVRDIIAVDNNLMRIRKSGVKPTFDTGSPRVK